MPPRARTCAEASLPRGIESNIARRIALSPHYGFLNEKREDHGYVDLQNTYSAVSCSATAHADGISLVLCCSWSAPRVMLVCRCDVDTTASYVSMQPLTADSRKS